MGWFNSWRTDGGTGEPVGREGWGHVQPRQNVYLNTNVVHLRVSHSAFTLFSS